MPRESAKASLGTHPSRRSSQHAFAAPMGATPNIAAPSTPAPFAAVLRSLFPGHRRPESRAPLRADASRTPCHPLHPGTPKPTQRPPWGCLDRVRIQPMNLRTSLLSLALWAASVTGLTAATPSTVVDIAVGSKDHTTLVAAVKAAGLVETLSGKGPFTVFAPTNAAFAKLPAGTVENLLKPENKAQLVAVLTHRLLGRVNQCITLIV